MTYYQRMRRWYWISEVLPLAAFFPLVLALSLMQPRSTLAILLSVAAFLALMVMYFLVVWNKIFRCPRCGKQVLCFLLPNGTWSISSSAPKKCPHCHLNLADLKITDTPPPMQRSAAYRE